MKSYPIWVDVENCNYKTSKSFGWRDTGSATYNIGSSSRNSSRFVDTRITRRRELQPDGTYLWLFRFSVDGIILKTSTWSDRDGRPHTELHTTSSLGAIDVTR